jgi:CheY-like chemotaxis protein
MCKILVIDDDSLQRASLRVGLEKLGHEVYTAENGRVAVKMLREGGLLPTLVVTDMVMPEMDGLEVIRHFQQHLPHIPVVAMSGELPESFLQLAKRLGARAALVKPVRADKVQETLNEILGALT